MPRTGDKARNNQLRLNQADETWVVSGEAERDFCYWIPREQYSIHFIQHSASKFLNRRLPFAARADFLFWTFCIRRTSHGSAYFVNDIYSLVVEAAAERKILCQWLRPTGRNRRAR